jgi:hypothetical protein
MKIYDLQDQTYNFLLIEPPLIAPTLYQVT